MRPTLALPLLFVLACAPGEAVVDKDDTNDTDTTVDSDTDPTVETDATETDDTMETDGTNETDDTDLTETDLLRPNEPPTAPEVTIVPGAPTSAENLVATNIFEATDPDGDAISYRYVWLVDGAPRAGVTSATVPAAQTLRGEVWEVRVRAFDGREEGPTASASTTVVNAPPTLSLSWTTPSPLSTDDLVVLPAAEDNDGDTLLLAFSWTRNGTATAFNSATVPSANTKSGEIWEVTVVATDGQGGRSEQSLATTIANRPPTIADLRILPNPASPSRNLRAEFTAADPDGDTLTVSYVWAVNGVVSAVQTSVVAASATSEGETWSVTVTADDRKGGTTSSTASITVANTAPVLASVSIEPATPGDNDNLVARIAVTDPDGDALTTTYTWYKNATLVRTGPNNTIVAGLTSLGDTWEVSATVSDGTATVGPVLSLPVTLIDRPPSDPVIRLDPEVPVTCADLVCRVTAVPVDPDGTSTTTTLRWLRNGVAWSGATLTTNRAGDTIPAASLTAGDTWTCEVFGTSGALSSQVVSDSGTVPITPVVVESFAIQARAQADVLLVVDDSCSMTDEQAALATAAEALLDELDRTGVDYHVGVVTTDMDDALRSGQLVPSGIYRYITPSTPNRLDVLSDMIEVGTNGSATERGLAAMRAALSTPLDATTNAGFARGGGALGVLFLSDEEDQSGGSLASYTSFLLGLRANPDDIVTRGLIGPPPSGCTNAVAGNRYVEFLNGTGGAWTSICAPAFQLSMAEMGGAVAGLPRVFALSAYPSGAITVEAVLGGTRTTLVQGSDWFYEDVSNIIVLITAPVSGVTLEVSFEAGCQSSGPGDTDVDTGLFTRDSTDSGFFPFPFPTSRLTPGGASSDTGATFSALAPSTSTLWGPTSFP